MEESQLDFDFSEDKNSQEFLSDGEISRSSKNGRKEKLVHGGGIKLAGFTSPVPSSASENEATDHVSRRLETEIVLPNAPESLAEFAPKHALTRPSMSESELKKGNKDDNDDEDSITTVDGENDCLLYTSPSPRDRG